MSQILVSAKVAKIASSESSPLAGTLRARESYRFSRAFFVLFTVKEFDCAEDDFVRGDLSCPVLSVTLCHLPSLV